MQRKDVVHVIPGTPTGWQVRLDGVEQVTQHDTRREAVKAAKAAAATNTSIFRIIVHGRGGQIEAVLKRTPSLA